jgi:prophage maintenance system killer protein
MHEIEDYLTESRIIEVNKSLGYSILNKSLVGSAISSWHYYKKPTKQVSSIVLGITKNHAFSDGNKRTATVTYYALCDLLKLKALPEDKMEKVILKIAASKNMTVLEVNRLLF